MLAHIDRQKQDDEYINAVRDQYLSAMTVHGGGANHWESKHTSQQRVDGIEEPSQYSETLADREGKGRTASTLPIRSTTFYVYQRRFST